MRHLWALLAVLLMTMSACGATGEETAAPADDAAAATGDADAATSGDDATPAGADAVATEGAESGCVPAAAAAGGRLRGNATRLRPLRGDGIGAGRGRVIARRGRISIAGSGSSIVSRGSSLLAGCAAG